MLRSREPKKLWYLSQMYVADTQSLTAHPIYNLYGRNPYDILNGDTPDILEFLNMTGMYQSGTWNLGNF